MSAGTGNLPNQNMDFVPLATLPAADLDKLVDNIEALADGTGIGDGSVTTVAIADANVTNAKLATGAGEPGGAWQNWTPTLTNHTGTINSARYTQIGKTVHFDLRVTITAVTGGLAFTLPVTGKAGVIENDRIFLSSLHMFDAGTAHHWGILTGSSTTNAAELWYKNGTSTAAITSPTGPFTWAAGDVYVATGTYEAA